MSPCCSGGHSGFASLPRRPVGCSRNLEIKGLLNVALQSGNLLTVGDEALASLLAEGDREIRRAGSVSGRRTVYGVSDVLGNWM